MITKVPSFNQLIEENPELMPAMTTIAQALTSISDSEYDPDLVRDGVSRRLQPQPRINTEVTNFLNLLTRIIARESAEAQVPTRISNAFIAYTPNPDQMSKRITAEVEVAQRNQALFSTLEDQLDSFLTKGEEEDKLMDTISQLALTAPDELAEFLEYNYNNLFGKQLEILAQSESAEIHTLVRSIVESRESEINDDDTKMKLIQHQNGFLKLLTNINEAAEDLPEGFLENLGRRLRKSSITMSHRLGLEVDSLIDCEIDSYLGRDLIIKLRTGES